MEGLDDRIASVTNGMGNMLVEETEEPSVLDHGRLSQWGGSQERMVFSIPGLMDQIVTECALNLSTRELLALRLVSKDFNESVLNIQAFPINLEKPWMQQPNLSILEICHQDNEYAEPLRLRRLSSIELEDIEPRICRHITAEFGFNFERHHRGDYGSEDAVAFHNLVGICGIHGPRVRTMTLREFHVAEHHLVILMKAIDNHCPNLNNFEVYIRGSCSDPAPHEGEYETLTFGPHFSLTEITFNIVHFVHGDATDSLQGAKPCGYTLPVMSALVKGSPNLECLKAGNAQGHLCLDLSCNKKLRSFEYFADAKDSQQSFQNQWKAIHDIRETLEELEIFLFNDKPPSVEIEIPEPPGLVFPKIKQMDLRLNGHIDPAVRAVLGLILDGMAPQLEYLRFGAGLDCWHSVMSSRALHSGSSCWNVTILEGVSLLWNYDSAVHHLHSLVKTFPRLVEIQMGVVIVVHPPSEDELRELLVRLVLAFRTWQQLSTVRFKVERDLFGCSIQDLLLQIWDGDTGENDDLVWIRASVAPAVVPAAELHDVG